MTYADGTKATVDQMAKDVSAFLVWTAEPELERRHAAGLAIVIFLLFATVLGYLAYRNIWAEAKRKVALKGRWIRTTRPRAATQSGKPEPKASPANQRKSDVCAAETTARRDYRLRDLKNPSNEQLGERGTLLG